MISRVRWQWGRDQIYQDSVHNHNPIDMVISPVTEIPFYHSLQYLQSSWLTMNSYWNLDITGHPVPWRHLWLPLSWDVWNRTGWARTRRPKKTTDECYGHPTLAMENIGKWPTESDLYIYIYVYVYTVRRKTCCVKHDRGWWVHEKQQDKDAGELLEASFVRCSAPACRPQGRAQKSLPMFQSMGPFLGSKFGPKIGSILVTNKYGIHASNSSRASLSCCFSFIHHLLSCFTQHVFLRTVYIYIYDDLDIVS